MSKFKAGDRVICTAPLEYAPGDDGILTVKSGPFGTLMGGNYYFEEIDEIILGDYLQLVKEKTMDNLQKGDVVYRNVPWGDYEFHVEGRIGAVYVGFDEETRGALYTAEELEHEKYQLKKDEPKELTVEEISKELGYDVKVVKG